MINWKKQLALLGLSTSLVATSFSPISGIANEDMHGQHTLIKDYIQEKVREKKNHAPSLSKDTLIIKYKSPISYSEHSRAGGTPIKSVSKLNYTVVKVKKKGSIEKVAEAYKKLGKVELVSPSAMYTTQQTNDPKVKEQYHLSLLQIEKAQQLAGNRSVKVAVIDQGVDRNHPDLTGQLLPGYNTVNPINQGSPDYHGTHVSGILAAKKNNAIGGYGVNPNADILNIDVFDRSEEAYDFAIADAILYAVENGAKVINMSIGSSMPSPLIEDAIKKAIKANVTVVASAGNNGDDSLNYPAAFEGVISVGSTNKDNKLSSYSSYGPSVDIVAPGENVYAPIYDYERKSSFDYLSGTSMASPVVAGIASLLLAKNPNLTPAQVEYVLEHTAKDLGAKGFDTKYANGLVDPLAALNFDVKKIPTSVKNPVTKAEILKQAKPITVGEKYTHKGKITKSNEEQWIKFEVKEGDYIQTTLQGADPYDYKYKMNLYSNDETEQIDVNQVREGKTEGKLFKVPFSGTLAIGIKDANGSFDDSGKGLSHYSLNIFKSRMLKEDNVDQENPVIVEKLPYTSNNKELTFTGDEGDEDFFKVSVKEKQMVRVKMTGVPGIDSSLNVYLGDQLNPPVEEPEESERDVAGLKPSHEEEIEPMYYSNSRGYGEGETVVFEAEPGMDYFISASNKMSYLNWMYDFFMNEQMMYGEGEYDSSNLTYEIEMEGKILPEDEDQYPMNDEPEEEYEEGNMDVEEYVSIKQESREIMEKMDDEEDEYQNMITQIQEIALPYQIGNTKSGYLQSSDDEDWYAISPNATGIYEFNFDSKGNVPMVEVYEMVTEVYEDGETTYFGPIGGNYSFDWYGVTLNNKMNIGLKRGNSYFVKVMNNEFNENSISFDKYSFTSKLKVRNPEDPYENNNRLENVKYLPAKQFTGNFSMPNDQDIFYLKKQKADTLYGVNIDRSKVTKDLQKKYPSELLGDFYSAAVVFEDSDNNRTLDELEFDTIRYLEKGWQTGNTSGSFLAKKNKGYIIAFVGMTEDMNPSLLPYTAKVEPVNKKDEDKNSTVKNNTPSKPLSLKQLNSKTMTAKAYLNAGVINGDTDWYTLKMTKAGKAKITFAFNNEVDGIISIYKDGKLVRKGDYYGSGDQEVLLTDLKKGNYFIEVKDTNRNASLNPYTLKVEF